MTGKGKCPKMSKSKAGKKTRRAIRHGWKPTGKGRKKKR